MTWTAICKDLNGNIIHKVTDAPHGAKDAWDYIVETFQLDLIAIVSGSHEVYSNCDLSKACGYTLKEL